MIGNLFEQCISTILMTVLCMFGMWALIGFLGLWAQMRKGDKHHDLSTDDHSDHRSNEKSA